MAVLPIVQLGAPVLRQIAQNISLETLRTTECQRFIDDLIETMRDANGAGLAANQVDNPVQICVIEVKPNNPRYPYKPQIPLKVLVNPVLTPVGEQRFLNYEGCLSVPNLRGQVSRYQHVHIRYLDRDGEAHEEEVHGVTAGTYQHELDHLDGKLFVDRVADTTSLCTWDNFEKYHKSQFVAYITELQKELGLST